MRKIGILILAHKNIINLIQIYCLFPPDKFDFYIHYDKNSPGFGSYINLTNNYKNFYMISDYKTYWGSFNQILATIRLIEKALSNDSTDYHGLYLVSGQDLPIKDPQTIYETLSNTTTHLKTYSKFPVLVWNKGGENRFNKFWFPIYNQRMARKLSHFINLVSNWIPYTRKKINIDLYGGSQWFYLAIDHAEYLINYLSENNKIMNRFRFTMLADEFFFHSVLLNKEENNIVNDSYTFIDWISGPEYPKLLHQNDLLSLVNSKYLFARKFVLDNDNIVSSLIKLLDLT